MQNIISNKQHIVDVNTLMLQLISNYAAFAANFQHDDSDYTENTQMHIDDLVYNVAALQAFNKTHDADKLYNSIMQQDTFVREYFADVLDLLRDTENY